MFESYFCSSIYARFCARFFIIHEYVSLGQAIFDESIAVVKCYMYVYGILSEWITSMNSLPALLWASIMICASLNANWWPVSKQ